MDVDEAPNWLHVVFPRLSVDQIRALELRLGVGLPRGLRAFLRCCGGVSLFAGAFHVAGCRRAGFGLGDAALQPLDLVGLNHELDAAGWRPDRAVAFAVNAWDQSVHLAGMPDAGDAILRCDRRTGQVMERHADVFACVAARLSKLDDLFVL
jgi:hypothetical protein